jgi:hypothetical protein
MHDKEYELEPPPRTYRIAMLGASHVMGTGVLREQTFEALVEERLNAENDREAADNVEVLNFAVWAYRPIQQLKVLEERVLRFKPNAVFYVEHPGDNRRLIINLVEALMAGHMPPYPPLQEIIEQAGVDRETPEPIMRRKLKPHVDDMVAWLYGEIVATCKRNGIDAVFISLPTVSPDREPANFELAKAAGFKVVDLKGAYDGRKWWELVLSEWDSHPTPEGHQMVAKRLYGELRRGNLVPIGFRTPIKEETRESPVKQAKDN